MKRISFLLKLLPNVVFLQKKPSSVLTRPSTEKRALIEKVPVGSWDSHMHVVSIMLNGTDTISLAALLICNINYSQIDPVNYPLAKGALYTPQPHLLPDALRFEQSTAIRNIVLVQPSIYGTDNSCLLDALRILGPRRARAVVAFDPETIDRLTLDQWHLWGVRGVRVNTQSIGKHMCSEELAVTLQRYANIIRPYNWVLQLYVPLETAVVLEKIVPGLGVTVCLDHFGSPDLISCCRPAHNNDPYRLPGFRSLVNLLSQGNTYVKLSAPYRISRGEGRDDLEPVARELLRVAGMNRAVFASDWPHTRFEGLDIKPYMEELLEWCGNDEALIQRVFRGNAERLWGIEH
ncbi:hypothetical protein BJX64DRAFT_288214 [Aspergillus heterothallicus]